MSQAAMNHSPTLEHVTSADGTAIAYERVGDGPRIVLVAGAAVDRSANAGMVAALASDFTVHNFDRRGRGDSSDTQPYEVDREIEDVAAMLDAAGGRAHLFGASSGAALALRAAARGIPVTRLVLWEPPFMTDASKRPPTDAAATLERLVAEGRRADAVTYFMSKVVGMPPEAVDSLRSGPWWAGQVKLAHTLAYDDRILGDYSVPVEAAKRIAAPTLILTGGKSFPFFRKTAQALAAAIPDGRADVLEGLEHVPDPAVLARAMRAFLKD